MVMVAAPVMLVTGASAYLGTTTVDAAESVPAALGHAQARMGAVGHRVDQQSVDAGSFSGGEEPETAFSGRATGQDWTAADLTRLTGAPVSAVGYPRLTVRPEQGGTVAASGLALDPSLLESSGLATLVSGRWPTSDREIVITAHGGAAGLPSSGTVTVTDTRGITAAAAVVGVVSAQDAEFRPLDLVVGPRFAGLSEQYYPIFLMFGTQPVDWAGVHRLNGYGLTVLSPTVLNDPPSPADPYVIQDSTDGFSSAVVVLTCLALVLETTLLAGPAFAVSAGRRRLALALVAGNGGDRHQVARYVLAQGLALGAVAAVLGGLVGTGSGWAVARFAADRAATVPRGPLDLYPALTVTIVVAAAAAALVAAALPARGAARLAVAGAMSPAARPRSHRVVSVAGGVLLLLGGITLPAARALLHGVPGLLTTGVGAAGLIIGAVLTAPAWLGVVARLLRPAPVAVRMAGRDLSRSSSRSVPAVAAILVAVAVLLICVVADASVERRGQRDYAPQLAAGHGHIVSPGPSGDDETRRAVDQARLLHPDWLIGTWGRLGDTDDAASSGRTTAVAVVPRGCDAARTLAPAGGDADPVSDDRGCQRLGSNARLEAGTRPSWGLGPVRLTAVQQQVLDAGGLLINAEHADGLLTREGVTVAVGTVLAADGSQPRLTRTVRLPATTVTREDLARLTFTTQAGEEAYGALAASDRIRGDLPAAVESYEIADPGGAISRTDQAELTSATTSWVTIERGYESGSRTLVLILCTIAGALAALAAVIATALAQVELRPDLSTLSAVGAAAGFRRRLAVSQAVVLACSGVAAGLLVGAGPAAAFGLALTTDRSTESLRTVPMIAFPWPTITAVAVAVPLLAALAATLVTGRAPTLHRRET